MSGAERKQYPWGTHTPGLRLEEGCASLRKALSEVRIEGFRKIPARVRKVLDVSERVVSTLEYIARSGLPGRPKGNRVAAAGIVEQVGRLNEAVRSLASASAQTLSPRYLELVARLEALLEVAERVRERGVDGDISLIPSNAASTDTKV